MSIPLDVLRDALLVLPKVEYDTLIDEVTRERRRRMYAEFEAARLPGLIARWEADTKQYGQRPYCREYEDGMDGFVVHTRACRNWPKSFLSGPDCLNLTHVSVKED